MRTFLLALLLALGVAPPLHAQASPYSNSVFASQTFTASGQTSQTIQLNGLVIPSTVGSSFSVGTITVTGSSLTTATLSFLGSSDNGATFYPLPITTVASPGSTPTTTVTVTANGIYQVNLAGITHIKFVTSGTFTATSVSVALTASPNATISRNNSGGGALLPTATGAGQAPISTGAGNTYAAKQVLPVNATYTFYTAGTGCANPSVPGATVCARNNATGNVDYSGTDAAVVINQVLALLVNTGGTLYFKNGTYNFNSCTLETISPYTTLCYAVGIPSTNNTNYPQFNFVGESTNGGIGNSTGVVFNVTAAAVTAAGANQLDAFWMRPSTDNSRGYYWNGQMYFQYVFIVFPDNQRGNEIAIDALESSYLQTMNVGANFATTPTALGAANLTAFRSPGTPSNGVRMDLTQAGPGWNDGFEIDTEHSVLINTVSYNNTAGYEIGATLSRTGFAIGHSGQWIHPQVYDCVYGILTESHVLQNVQIDMFGYDLEAIHTGTWAFVDSIETGNGTPGNNVIGGFISWNGGEIGGVPLQLTTPFGNGTSAGGWGLNYTVEVNGTTSVQSSTAGSSSSPLSAINTAAASTDQVFNFLAPNATSGTIGYFGVSQSLNNASQLAFYYAGSGNAGNAGYMGLYGATTALTWFGNGGVRFGGGAATPAANQALVGAGGVLLPSFTVATLPSASTLGAGAQVVVTDATTFTPGTCTGGGSDTMIAVSNGTAWSCH